MAGFEPKSYVVRRNRSATVPQPLTFRESSLSIFSVYSNINLPVNRFESGQL